MQKKFERIVEHQGRSVRKYIDMRFKDLNQDIDIDQLKITFKELSGLLKGNSKEDKAARLLIETISNSNKIQVGQLEDITKTISLLKQSDTSNNDTVKDLLQKLQAIQDFLYFDDDKLVDIFDNALFGDVDDDTTKGL